MWENPKYIQDFYKETYWKTKIEMEEKIILDRNKSSCEDATWDKISHYAQW